MTEQLLHTISDISDVEIELLGPLPEKEILEEYRKRKIIMTLKNKQSKGYLKIYNNFMKQIDVYNK
jgi:hypothetical protein